MSRSASALASSPSESEAVHRSFKVNRIDPHPKRKIIIIHGELSVSIIGAGAISIHDSLAEDTREFKKVIRLDSLNPSIIDPNEIMEQILIECPYIIEQDTLDLLALAMERVISRKYDANGLAIGDSRKNACSNNKLNEGRSEDESDDDEDDDEFSSSSSFPNIFDDEDYLTTLDNEADLKEVTMDDLENYIELLYEDLQQEKAKGAYCISKLVTMSENMIIIFNHESVLNALFRTLREDYKKSMDLTTNILRVFLQFAEFIDFHQHLLSHKLSSVIFEIIEYELDVYGQWKSEIESRKNELNSFGPGSGNSGGGGDNNSVGAAGSGLSTKAIKAKVHLERIQLRFDELTNKQNNLLNVALKIIKCLRQSIPIEELHKKEIVKITLTFLERKHYELLSTTVEFLSILSTYQECKLQLLKFGLLDVAQQFLNTNEYPLTIVQPALVLHYNLSFDTKSRQKMIKHGVLDKVALIFDTGSKHLQQKCILLLYNFSMDRKNRPKFATTNIVHKILHEIGIIITTTRTTVTTTGEEEIAEEDNPMNIYLIALLLNLATSKRCSQILFKNNGLSLLIQWAFKQENHLIMKIIRKLAEHELSSNGGNIKNEFIQYISDIAQAISKTTNIEFIIECIATLGNLNIEEIDFKRLLEHCKLLTWIKTVLKKQLPVRSTKRKNGESRTIDETLFIEIVIFLSTCVEDIECTKYIIQDDLTLRLLALLDNSLNIDHDIKIQTIYVFYKICQHKSLLGLIIGKTKIPDTMIKLLQNNSEQLRGLAEAVLDLIGEFNSEWNSKVKQEKFTAYNHHWLEMISRPDDQHKIEETTVYIKQQPKRPSSAMRRPPSAIGPSSSQSSSARFISNPRSQQMENRTSKESIIDLKSDTTTTTSEDESEGEDGNNGDEIDVEEDDEQFSKQKQQRQQNKHSSSALLNDSIENQNIFDRFKHQFQQERDAQERNEYYGIINNSDDLDEGYYYEDEDADSQRNGISGGGGGSSSGSEILVPFNRRERIK